MHSHTRNTSRTGRISAAIATATLAAAALLIVAAPASAHDELVSSDPAAGATVATLPAQLTLTFSGDLLGDAGATQVQVTDASGTSIAAGSPVVQANVVTQPITPGASGAISVLWRAVSSDGHPVSGQYGFTVTGAPTPSPTPTASPAPSPTASAVVTETPTTPSPTAAPASTGSGSASLPWILIAVIGVAVLGAVVYLLTSRARRANELAGARTAGTSASASTPPSGASEPGPAADSDR